MAVRVLIVEDEEQIARFTELELRHEGYEVAKAMDGRTGLSMAEEGNYDIILLDIMLPELNGLEVLRRLRRPSKRRSKRPPRRPKARPSRSRPRRPPRRPKARPSKRQRKKPPRSPQRMSRRLRTASLR